MGATAGQFAVEMAHLHPQHRRRNQAHRLDPHPLQRWAAMQQPIWTAVPSGKVLQDHMLRHAAPLFAAME